MFAVCEHLLPCNSTRTASHRQCFCMHRLCCCCCCRCLLYRYAGLYSLAQLHGQCPLCRGVCTCRKCLRSADHTKLQPPPAYSSQQLQQLGRYSLRMMGPLLASMMRQQQQEVRAGLG
jgi:hypothetical protein